jgi:hypothetical protein
MDTRWDERRWQRVGRYDIEEFECIDCNWANNTFDNKYEL